MIFGAHVILHSADAEADRTFFKDVLGFPSVDAGHGWLIFALPPAELGIHPTDSASEDGRHMLYLMCDDIVATVAELQGKGVEFTAAVKDAGWGLLAAMRIPGGGELQLYQPKHRSPLSS